MMVFTIQDTEGNFVSNMSFQQEGRGNNRWFYVCYTGRCEGMRYYTNIGIAKRVLQDLEVLCEKLLLRRSFKIVEISMRHLPMGEILISQI